MARRTVVQRIDCDEPSHWKIGFIREDEGPLVIGLYFGDKNNPTHEATIPLSRLREILADLGLE